MRIKDGNKLPGRYLPEGAISTGKVRDLLGLATRLEADAFLKARGVYLNYDEADFKQDMLTMQKLEQEGKLKQA